jgi:hypothetical protein
MASKAQPRRVPFLARRQSSEFGSSVARFIQEQVDMSLERMVAAENRMQLTHGQSWSTGPKDIDKPSQMKSVSSEVSLLFAALANNDMSAMRDGLAQISEQMVGSIHTDLYSLVSEVSEATGSVVSKSAEGSYATAFLAALKQIDFGVDRAGKVTLPAVHAPPTSAEKMLAELNAQGPEFRAEVERITAEKTEAALARERERLGKYKT